MTPRINKRLDMFRRVTWLALFVAVITAGVVDDAANVSARQTNPGFKSTKLAIGRFDKIDVLNHFALLNRRGEKLVGQKSGSTWFSSQKTNGPSDLYIQSNVFQPGGSTGWHTHPAHSLIVVTEGTITGYEGHDPDCTPRVYTQGMGFVDPGGDHVHILRNEGKVLAKTIAVQLIPATAAQRIEVADPGNCRF
jgi:hypothetical protein